MGNLLTIKYWLNTRPDSLSPLGIKVFVVFVAALLVGAFLFHVLKNRKKSLYTRIWQKFNSFCLINFFLGLMFLFFVYELIPFLSTRILMLFWALGMLIWLIFIVRFMFKIPKIKEEREKEKEFKKYIP